MRLNKKYTINKYINMKCCWRSVAVTHKSDEIEDISKVNEEYLNFDISKIPHSFLGNGHYGECYKITMNKKIILVKK